MMVAMSTPTRVRDSATGRFVKTTEPDVVQQLESALGSARGTIYDLEERLRGVDQMIDERGWHQLFAHDALDGGLTLAQIKAASDILRELVAGNPMMKRGLRARMMFVWGGGVEFGGRKANGEPTTLTAAVQAVAKQRANKRWVFSNTAHEELESAAFTDGNIFLLGDDGSKNVQRIALAQITADLRNPDNQEEVWMFRREWDRNPNGTTEAERDHQVRWYYTDAFDGVRKGTVKVTGTSRLETVDKTKTLLHIAVNQQAGWAYGIPDALPIVAWVKLYREFLTNGYLMSRALAQIAFKVTAASAAGGSRAAAEVAMPGQAGGAYATGQGGDLTAVATAGKGYDFASGKPLAAAIAAGIEISVNTLLGETDAAVELDLSTRAAAEMRRLTWADAYERIYAYLGNQRDLRVTWHDLPIEQIQRQMQAWTLARNMGVFEGEVIQAGVARTLRIADPGSVPSDYTTKPTGNASDPNGTTGSGGATDGTGQGQGDGSSGSSGNDHSTD